MGQMWLSTNPWVVAAVPHGMCCPDGAFVWRFVTPPKCPTCRGYLMQAKTKFLSILLIRHKNA